MITGITKTNYYNYQTYYALYRSCLPIYGIVIIMFGVIFSHLKQQENLDNHQSLVTQKWGNSPINHCSHRDSRPIPSFIAVQMYPITTQTLGLRDTRFNTSTTVSPLTVDNHLSTMSEYKLQMGGPIATATLTTQKAVTLCSKNVSSSRRPRPMVPTLQSLTTTCRRYHLTYRRHWVRLLTWKRRATGTLVTVKQSSTPQKCCHHLRGAAAPLRPASAELKLSGQDRLPQVKLTRITPYKWVSAMSCKCRQLLTRRLALPVSQFVWSHSTPIMYVAVSIQTCLHSLPVLEYLAHACSCDSSISHTFE